MTLIAQPLICVTDVVASSRWYCTLLGGTSGHGGAEYERIMIGDTYVLQLHDFEVDHHHGALGDRSKPLGNGVLLWFQVADFDAAAARARALHATVVEDVHENPNAGQRELWLRDPDGYTVVLASLPE